MSALGRTEDVADSSSTKPREPLFLLLGLVLVTACLYWARQVLIPLALAVLLAFILTPAVSALQRRGLGRLPSVLMVVTLALLLLSGIGYVSSRQINTFAEHLPNYQGELIKKLKPLLGGEEEDVSQRIQELFGEIKQAAWSHLGEAASQTAEGLADAFLVLVLVVFMLSQRENLRNRFVRLIGHGHLIATTQAVDEGAQRVSRYLYMLLFINTFFGVVLATGLLALGWVTGHHILWRYALLWGSVALVLRFVPYLGTWLVAVLLTSFAVATLPGWLLPLIVFAFFVLLELLTANVVEPLLFGHSTGVSPLALLLAAAFWIWLWGPVGLILSTPLTVILVVLGKYVPELKFFEVLLGDEPVLSRDVTFYQRLVAHDLDEAADLVEDHRNNHPPESVYEEILLPALLHARRDYDRGELDPDNYEYVLQSIRDIEEDLASALAEQFPQTAETRKGQAVGWPVRDEGDELALVMLGQMLRLRGYTLEVLSAKKLTAELLDHLQREPPAVVCLGSLPPGGLSQTRYLCKRIRREAPGVKIVVGRWADSEKIEHLEKRLRDAGMDLLATSLSASRDQIIPLVQVAANAAPKGISC
jgi:predicted PurR-regulated permease PerM